MEVSRFSRSNKNARVSIRKSELSWSRITSLRISEAMRTRVRQGWTSRPSMCRRSAKYQSRTFCESLCAHPNLCPNKLKKPGIINFKRRSRAPSFREAFNCRKLINKRFCWQAALNERACIMRGWVRRQAWNLIHKRTHLLRKEDSNNNKFKKKKGLQIYSLTQNKV